MPAGLAQGSRERVRDSVASSMSSGFTWLHGASGSVHTLVQGGAQSVGGGERGEKVEGEEQCVHARMLRAGCRQANRYGGRPVCGSLVWCHYAETCCKAASSQHELRSLHRLLT